MNDYQRVTCVKRRPPWSRGLQARLDLCDERTDDEIVDDVEADEVLAELDAEGSALSFSLPSSDRWCPPSRGSSGPGLDVGRGAVQGDQVGGLMVVWA